MHFLLAIFALSFLLTSCDSKVPITGHWRHRDAVRTYGADKTPRFGDLIIRADSNYVAPGPDDEPDPPAVSRDNAASYTGKWTYSGNRLILYPKGVPGRVVFHVIRISLSDLVLEQSRDTFRFRRVN